MCFTTKGPSHTRPITFSQSCDTEMTCFNVEASGVMWSSLSLHCQMQLPSVKRTKNIHCVPSSSVNTEESMHFSLPSTLSIM